jgi:hypothetical protein
MPLQVTMSMNFSQIAASMSGAMTVRMPARVKAVTSSCTRGVTSLSRSPRTIDGSTAL